MTLSPRTWLRPRPHSWVFWPIGLALASLWPALLALLLGWRHWPRTAVGWATLAAVALLVQAAFDRLRNPVMDNELARRLEARTDRHASGLRVLYLLGAGLAAGAGLMLVVLALSVVLPPLAPSLQAFLERHFH
jgi:hypothetical protein